MKRLVVAQVRAMSQAEVHTSHLVPRLGKGGRLRRGSAGVGEGPVIAGVKRDQSRLNNRSCLTQVLITPDSSKRLQWQVSFIRLFSSLRQHLYMVPNLEPFSKSRIGLPVIEAGAVEDKKTFMAEKLDELQQVQMNPPKKFDLLDVC